MYRYETHCHTKPVSRCGRAGVRETLTYYRDLGYTGGFITTHFITGNCAIEKTATYEDRINFFFSDYEEALAMQEELGIRVFVGAEMSHNGTDFLVYGPDKAWYLAHPEIMEMKITDLLKYMMDAGALVVQAHPFRDAGYIPYIRLLPNYVHGVEVNNASRSDFDNHMAEIFAKEYGLIPHGGSDNHDGPRQRHLAGMSSEAPIADEWDFVRRFLARELEVFVLDVPAEEQQP